MKPHVIHHSNIERGTIRFHRHGVSRVTVRDMLTHPPGHCGNCITGASSSFISCHSTPNGYKIHLGFRVRRFPKFMYVSVLILIQDTSGTIRVYPLSKAKEHVTICKLYDLARVFTSTTLADAPKEVSRSTSTFTLLLICYRLSLVVAIKTH